MDACETISGHGYALPPTIIIPGAFTRRVVHDMVVQRQEDGVARAQDIVNRGEKAQIKRDFCEVVATRRREILKASASQKKLRKEFNTSVVRSVALVPL